MTGRIVKAVSGFYYVCSEDKIYECRARGSFRKNGISPLTGDMAEITASDGAHGTVEAILPRKNSLYRPVIANIDKLFIISSYSVPAPNPVVIDRLTAIAEYNGIEPVIVFNKCDMGSFEQLEGVYRHAGFSVYTVSALTGEGIEALRSELSDGISAFTGNSGVGKSSILNTLFPGLGLATGQVSEKLGRGRHTTRHTELYKTVSGGYIADTPGFSSIEVDRNDYGFKESLADSFRDFRDFIYECKYTSCTHTGEKGCSLKRAVDDGKIEPSRYNSYIEIFNELKTLKPWEADKK